jgi:hypothetical protein
MLLFLSLSLSESCRFNTLLRTQRDQKARLGSICFQPAIGQTAVRTLVNNRITYIFVWQHISTTAGALYELSPNLAISVVTNPKYILGFRLISAMTFIMYCCSSS